MFLFYTYRVKLTVFFPKENISKQIDAQVGMTVFEAILKHDDCLLPSKYFLSII